MSPRPLNLGISNISPDLFGSMGIQGDFDEALEQENFHDFFTAAQKIPCQCCEIGRKAVQRTGISRPVICRGNPTSKIMLIGEAPGKTEWSVGRAFVGPAGKKLDDLVESLGFRTNIDFFICNIVTCWPADLVKESIVDRPPTNEEAITCSPLLLKIFQLVKPEFIVCLGLRAATFLLHLKETTKAGAVVNKWYGIKPGWLPNVKRAMIVYHPAYILHSGKSQGSTAAAAVKEGFAKIAIAYREWMLSGYKTLPETTPIEEEHGKKESNFLKTTPVA